MEGMEMLDQLEDIIENCHTIPLFKQFRYICHIIMNLFGNLFLCNFLIVMHIQKLL